MDLETLEHFKYIAKYQNVTRAAKHFYISQSTLSRQIMALESEFNAPLFIRTNKKIELTEAGKLLYRDCDLLIKHIKNIMRNVQAANQGTDGTLTITCPGHLCSFLPQSLNRLKTLYPSVRFIVESYDFNEIPCSIQYDIYNIGFTYDFAVPTCDGLEAVHVGADDFSLAVPASRFPEASPEAIVEAVQTLPLLLPSYIEPPFLRLIIHELQNISDTKNINKIYVNTTDSATLQISLGLGYSIVPTALTRTKCGDDNITYIPLDHFAAKGNIVMLYKKENASELLNTFINIVKDIAV